VLTSNELASFQSTGIAILTTAGSWISAEQVPANQAVAEKAMLSRDGFRAGAREDLLGSGGTAALSEVEQLRSPTAARDALAFYAAQFKATPAPSGAYAPFKVSGIPGAVGFSLGGGISIAFSDGSYYYLVSQEGDSAAAIANLNTAARHLYDRVHA
jgi:hypothetical protein